MPPVGFEPTTNRLKVYCATNCATEAKLGTLLKPGPNPRTLDLTAVMVFDCYGCLPTGLLLAERYCP